MEQYTGLKGGVWATKKTTQGSVLNENNVAVWCLRYNCTTGSDSEGAEILWVTKNRRTLAFGNKALGKLLKFVVVALNEDADETY